MIKIFTGFFLRNSHGIFGIFYFLIINFREFKTILHGLRLVLSLDIRDAPSTFIALAEQAPCLAVFMFLETGIEMLQRSALVLSPCEWIPNLKLVYFMHVFEILSLERFV